MHVCPAATWHCCAGIFDIAMSYVQVDADFLEADEASMVPPKTMVSACCPASTEQSSRLSH